MKLIPLTILSTLLTVSSYAWNEGNGGMGVLDHGMVYTLDLYENGLSWIYTKSVSQPKFAPAAPLIVDLASRFQIPIDDLQGALENSNKISPAFTQSLKTAWSNIHWVFTTAELPSTHDDYPVLSNRQIPPEKMVQLAVRRGHLVQIQESYFGRLHISHKIALLFHEGISTVYFANLGACPIVPPTSQDVRNMTRILLGAPSEYSSMEFSFLDEKILFRRCDLY